MAQSAANPALPTLDASLDTDRERATPVALKALRRVFEHWRLTNEESAQLMGVSERTWNRMKGETWAGSLSQDQLLRASGLIGIFKGLHLYFGEPLADDWITLANSGPSFQDRRPVDAMIQDGLIAIYSTRDYVDALRGGL